MAPFIRRLGITHLYTPSSMVMAWWNKAEEEVPTDRGITVPTVNPSNCTYTEYVQARCSSLLVQHYETEGESLIGQGESLAEKLERGFNNEVLRPSLLRW